MANGRHFDRWVVVTVCEDKATRAVCARHGIEVLLSRTLRADGKDFDAAHNKSRALNEGLEALDPEGWVVIVDSDVLLPRHFRARVEALPLERGCLYAAAGRKICVDREMFEMLRECEPWDRFCDRHSQAIGYFNLFHLAGAVNRYVVRKAGAGWSHDDWHFTTSFPEECRRHLPMTVIHTGPPGANWSGRVARSYHAEAVGEASRELPVEIGGKGSVAVIGYFPGCRWREVASRFAKALLVDHFQVHHPSGSPMVEADRGALRALWEKEAAGIGNVELLGTHRAGTLAGIADGSLDALYLPGEATPDWLVPALPHWLEKLKPDALICGDLFGLPHWPDSTYAISLLLGVPDGVEPSGFWWKRVAPVAAGAKGGYPLARPVRVESGNPATPEGNGVMLLSRGGKNLEKVLMSLHSLRRGWAGAVTVCHWGEPDHSLAIRCARYRAELREGGESEGEDAELADAAREVSPYARTLFIPAGTLLVADPAALFRETGAPMNGESAHPHRCLRTGGGVQRVAVSFSPAQEWAAQDSALCVCTGKAETWSEAAWETWCAVEAEMTQRMAAPIRVPEDATVVLVVHADEAADFERTWLALKFSPAVPVLLFLVGIGRKELWLEGNPQVVKTIELSASAAPEEVLEQMIAHTGTPRLIFLPSTASPLPGAEGFASQRWRAFEAVLHAVKNSQKGESADLVPTPLFGIVTRGYLERAGQSGNQEESLAVLLKRRADVEGERTLCVDLRDRGWSFAAARPFSISHPP